MRDEIIGNGGEDALKNIGSTAVTLGFQVSFAQQTVGFSMFGIGCKNVAAMCYRLIDLTFPDGRFNFAQIRSQGDFRHKTTLAS